MADNSQEQIAELYNSIEALKNSVAGSSAGVGSKDLQLLEEQIQELNTKFLAMKADAHKRVSAEADAITAKVTGNVNKQMKAVAQGTVDLVVDVEERLNRELATLDRKSADRLAESGSTILRLSSLMEVSGHEAAGHLRNFLKMEMN